MMVHRSTYSIEIAGLYRELQLFEVQPGLRIAILNILGDTDLVLACARALGQKLKTRQFDAIVTAETKSIPLAFALALETGKPYIVLRKHYRSYMGETVQAETISITTGSPQRLYMDEKDQALAWGKRVVLIDDVISTGSTLEGMKRVMQKINAEVVAEAAILTEGDKGRWAHIIALGHLPLFTD